MRVPPRLLVLLLIAVLGLAIAPDPATSTGFLEEAGPFEPVILLAAFLVGPLVAFPGTVLVALAVVRLQSPLDVVVLAVGTTSYLLVPFLLARRTTVDLVLPDWQRRLLARIDDHPLLVVAGLRMVGPLSPPLSAALALTRLDVRTYLLGSLLGLVVPFGALSALAEAVSASGR